MPYASLLNDPRTSEYLPPFRSYVSQPISVESAASLLESHRMDASRLSFSLWLSSQDDDEIPTYVGMAGLTRIDVDPVTGLRHGEAGLLLCTSAQSQGLVSEVLLAVLDLGFRPFLDHSSVVSPSYGLGLDRITFGTSQRNSRLRYWIETVLDLTPLPSEALSTAQKKDCAAWGLDALVFYHLYRGSWEASGGKREMLTKRVMERSQRNAAYS